MSERTAPINPASAETQKNFAKVVNQVTLAFRQFMQQKFRQYNFDLTFEMVQVMVYLWERDGVNQQEIANATLKDKASLTYLIDNLVIRELVTRQEDTVDRRNKLISLTLKGHQLRQALSPIVHEMHMTASMGIPQQDFEQALRILQQVCENLKSA